MRSAARALGPARAVGPAVDRATERDEPLSALSGRVAPAGGRPALLARSDQPAPTGLLCRSGPGIPSESRATGSNAPGGGLFGFVGYHSSVPDFYDLDLANSRLPELRQTLLSLRALKSEVAALRDRIVELNAPQAVARAVASAPAAPARDEADAETQRLRMRMQGLVDQMIATVAQIDGWHIQLREIESGLVDFPALVAGRPVWLCWRLGEDEVAWWHEVSDGFDGRRRMEDLV